MNESDILKFLLLDIDSATTDSIPVRTEGGDQAANPPEVIVSWNSTRLPNFQGHTNYACPVKDSNGVSTAKEYHAYYEMTADVLVRYESEKKRDDTLHEIQQYFFPYEADGDSFDKDTLDWEVGGAAARDNSFVEPDWYEASVPLTFTYVKRTEVTDPSRIPDTLSTIDVVVNSRDIVVSQGNTRVIESDETRYWDTLEVDGTLTVDGTLYVRKVFDSSGTIQGDGTVIVDGTPYSDIETQQATIMD